MSGPRSRSRDEDARTAGAALYNSFNANSNSLDQSVAASDAGRTESQLYNLRSFSHIRRAFCLFVLFDLIFTTVLWLVHTQLIQIGKKYHSIIEDVEHYSIESSLFDLVLAACCRFAILLLSYALFKFGRPWFVALTTLLSCGFLIIKLFYYQFAGDAANKSIADVIIIVAFVLPWIETWMLAFKVIPSEEEERRKAENMTRDPPNGSLGSQFLANERTPLLAPPPAVPGYFTPESTGRGSPTESDEGGFVSVKGSNIHSRTESLTSLVGDATMYAEQGRQAFDKSWDLINAQDGAGVVWKRETGTNETEGIVYSRQTKEYGKIFKLMAHLPIDAHSIWEDMVEQCEGSPRWNPAVLVCTVLQSVDESTDVCYSIAAEGAGGLVSSRDFVIVRHWRQLDGWFVSSSASVTHPSAPTDKRYVRAVQKPGCVRFRQVSASREIGKTNGNISSDGEECELEWVLCTDLKGWLPQYIIDQALSGVLMAYLKNLRTRCTELNNGDV